MKDTERMVISAYGDGEVEAPWKAQVEQRIASDPEWAQEAEVQARLRALLAAAPEPDFSQARERVRTRLEGPTPAAVRRFPVAWLSVAAALVVVAASGGFWLGRQSASSPSADLAELQVQVPKQLELKLTGEGQLLMASTLEGVHR